MNNEELVKAGWTLHNAATDKAPEGKLAAVIRADGELAVVVNNWGLMSKEYAGAEIVAYKLEQPAIVMNTQPVCSVEGCDGDGISCDHAKPEYTATTDEGGIVLACAAQLAAVITLYNDRVNDSDHQPMTAVGSMITLVGDVDYLVEKNAELETINATQVDQARAIMMASKITPEMIDTILLSMSINPDDFSQHVMIKSKHEATIFNASTAMFANRLNKLCGPIEDGENWAESMLRRTDEAGVEAAKLNVLLIAEKKESTNYRDYYNSLTSKLGDAEKALNTALITISDQAAEIKKLEDENELVRRVAETRGRIDTDIAHDNTVPELKCKIDNLTMENARKLRMLTALQSSPDDDTAMSTSLED